MPYQTAAQIRAAVSVLADADKFPNAVLTELVSEFEDIAERYRGVAFETRTVTAETHLIDRWRTTLRLDNVYVRTVSSLTVDGTALAGSGTDYYLDKPAGIIRAVSSFAPMETVVATYTHSLTAAATEYDGLIRACREYVRACALSDRSGVPRDVVGQSFDDGRYTRYNTPDWDKGRPTGWLEVDRLLDALPDKRRHFA